MGGVLGTLSGRKRTATRLAPPGGAAAGVLGALSGMGRPLSGACHSLYWVGVFLGSKGLFTRHPALGYSGGKLPAMASSRVMSMLHSIPVVYLSGADILSRGVSGVVADRTTLLTPYQEQVIMHSLAYFLVDSAYLAAYEPSPLFFLHHGIAATSFTTHLLANRGGIMVFMALFFGEMSAPLFTASWFARKRKADGAASFFFNLFGAVFLANRCLIIPVFTLPLVKELWRGDKNVPLWVCRMWAGMMVFGLGGGMIWAKGLLGKIAGRLRLGGGKGKKRG